VTTIGNRSIITKAHYRTTAATSDAANAGEGFNMSTGIRDRSSASDLFVKPDWRILLITASFDTERFVYTSTVSYLQVNGLRGVPGYDYRWVNSTRNDYGAPLVDFVAQDVDTSLTYKVPQTLPGGWNLDWTAFLLLDLAHFATRSSQ
jgi:hypothetical protein